MDVADFFPGEGLIFQGGGGGKKYYLPKHQKDTVYLKKVKKTYYFSCPREGGKSPLLPSPADARGVTEALQVY